MVKSILLAGTALLATGLFLDTTAQASGKGTDIEYFSIATGMTHNGVEAGAEGLQSVEHWDSARNLVLQTTLP